MTVKESKQELESWYDDLDLKLYIPGCPERLAPLETYPFEINKPVLDLECDYTKEE